jgi:hypothetical protein
MKFSMERCPGCARVGRYWLRTRYADGRTECRFCRRAAANARFAMFAYPLVAVGWVVLLWLAYLDIKGII